MTRLGTVQKLINKYNFKSYLEIGVVHRFVNIHRHLNCNLSTLIKTNFHE